MRHTPDHATIDRIGLCQRRSCQQSSPRAAHLSITARWREWCGSEAIGWIQTGDADEAYALARQAAHHARAALA